MRMPERVTEKGSANLPHRKSEGSAARMIRGGLVGPKGRRELQPMDNRSIFLYHPQLFDQRRTRQARGRGETSAVQAGREPWVSPWGVDREASTRVWRHTRGS